MKASYHLVTKEETLPLYSSCSRIPYTLTSLTTFFIFMVGHLPYLSHTFKMLFRNKSEAPFIFYHVLRRAYYDSGFL